MAFTIINIEKKNVLYTVAYRHLPIFEMGISVPNHPYYIQYSGINQKDVFDTSYNPPKKILLSHIMELNEDKISAILQTITLMNEMIDELNYIHSETF